MIHIQYDSFLSHVSVPHSPDRTRWTRRYGEALEDAKQATCVDASYTKGFYRLALCQKDPSDGCLGG